MANQSRERLLAEFLGGGQRSYSEAEKLLQAWGFTHRLTPGGHVVWTHLRGITLTITRTRELKVYYRKLIVRMIRQVNELEKFD